MNDLDDAFGRDEDEFGSKAKDGPNLFKGQDTSLQYGYNFALFEILIFLGSDFDLILESQFGEFIEGIDFVSVGAKVLDLFLDYFLDGECIGL